IKLFNKNIQGISEEKYNNFIQIDSLYNIGRCQEELGEIEEAINTFEETNQICQNKNLYSRSGSALFHLAFLYSCLGIFDKAKVCIKNLENDNLIKHLGIKSQGYVFLYLAKTYQNLQNIYESENNYRHCIEYSKKVNFIQLLAKALTGLAELNRIQSDLTNALSYHQESIKILEKIGAKCDLAEAYFQLALTYQKKANKASSEEYFNKALYLWSPEQIDAPKQIERVLKAMNS
ncbi:tetratricopeptide repeat protein, partial [Sphaerospermopsis aphanizomenoides BCCUSP55]|uniref:tetratricopeptide repeat protein n=1 Tax=Sphaerospermopsis aphanizomenoides TaxID=459663 RepID=UPI00190506D6